MKKTTLIFTATALLSVLSGCAHQPQTIYSWGGYEDQIYAMYGDPGKSSPEEQLLKLEADYEKAKAANKPVPPGYHAHLGYLYFQTGNLAKARLAFESEKALFPESTVYMNSLISRIKS